MTLVSIVTPSFKQGHFIQATIDSVLGQDYPHIEYMVMDGGSTDQTVDVLKTYTDPRMTWVSEADRGQSDAINKGFRRAKGDLLTWINSDDVLMPGAISAIVRHFEDNPNTGAVYGDVQLIDAAGAAWGLMQGKPFDLANALVGGQTVTQQGSTWRRAVMERVGLLDESLHYTMDLDYWLRIALAGFRLDYLPVTLGGFRFHSASKSTSMQTGFLRDWGVMLDKVYASPALPAHLRALRDDSFAFVDWGWAKTQWSAGHYAEARPLLRRFLRDKRWGRRWIAATMLTDSYLNTPFTRAAAFAFRKLTGREILIGERRAI